MLVHQFLENSANSAPDKTALVYGEQRCSYSELDQSADCMARSLLDLNLPFQTRVVIMAENSPETVISIFGALKAGMVFVLVNTGVKSVKLNYILKDSGARVLICKGVEAKVVKEAMHDCFELDHIIWCPEADTGERVAGISWQSFLTSGNKDNFYRSPVVIDRDLSNIIYTSGSTGEPKGVVCAHCNVVSASKSIAGYLEKKEEDVILNALPLSFDYGLYQIFMGFMACATVVLEKSFAFMPAILERIELEQVTGFPIVPSMAAMMFKMKHLENKSFRSLRYITNTAAVLPVTSIKRLRSLFPAVKIFSMYGLTECKRVSYLPPEVIDLKPESVGIPMPGTRVDIVDRNNHSVGNGKIGELIVRGPNVMQGYWNKEKETARVFGQGRYRDDIQLRTGDLFKRDDEGFLYFVGRKDDMIKTRGERVSPREIEEMILSMDHISEVAVIGVKDEIIGQAIKAVLVPGAGHKVDKKDVLYYCRLNLEPFMVPKYLEIRLSLPKSPNGKIDKKQLS